MPPSDEEEPNRVFFPMNSSRNESATSFSSDNSSERQSVLRRRNCHEGADLAGSCCYKVIRARMEDGSPTGAYQHFMTRFVLDEEQVWGRPAGIAVTQDGALLVSQPSSVVPEKVRLPSSFSARSPRTSA